MGTNHADLCVLISIPQIAFPTEKALNSQVSGCLSSATPVLAHGAPYQSEHGGRDRDHAEDRHHRLLLIVLIYVLLLLRSLHMILLLKEISQALGDGSITLNPGHSKKDRDLLILANSFRIPALTAYTCLTYQHVTPYDTA